MAEVGLGGGAHAVGALAQVDALQVLEQDLVLGRAPVELAGQHQLADLAHERALLARVGVLHVLLGDRRAALDEARAAHVGQKGPGAAPQVDSTVVVEVAVL